MNKFYFLVLSTALVLGASSCDHAETADETPAFVMSSDELVSAFLEDEQAANAKFNDLVLQVTGPVMEVSKENGMVTAVKLSSDEFNIVNCTFQNPVEASQIGEGQMTLKGICSGFMGDASSMLPGGTVELKRASIVQ